MEVLAERLVLDVVPSDAYAEPEASAAEQVYLRGLLGDQGGLALGKDDDGGYEPDAAGDASEVAERHERLVKRVGGGVVPRPSGPRGRVGAEDVVVEDEVFVAEVFRRLGELADGAGVFAELVLGEYDA